jgi:hypothetical protein
MTRFVVRPSAISKTPRALAHALEAETRRYPARTYTRFDFGRDLFLAYPPPSHVYNRPVRDSSGRFSSPFPYETLHSFFSASKYEQRKQLSDAGLPTPESYATRYEAAYAAPGRFVVRPIRHSGGRNYRLTEDSADFLEGHEYIARVFPKTAEYRQIFVFGQPLVLLKKKNRTEIPADQPWNHANGSSFITLRKPETATLTHCGFIQQLAGVPIIKHAHVAAVDIMFNPSLGPSICEVNACPGLTIEDNLEKVVAYVQDQHRPH